MTMPMLSIRTGESSSSSSWSIIPILKASASEDDDGSMNGDNSAEPQYLNRRFRRQKSRGKGFSSLQQNTTFASVASFASSSSQQQQPPNMDNNPQSPQYEDRQEKLEQRITQLEELVAKQAVDIQRLQTECNSLTEAAAAFSQVVELLRAAGLSPDLLSSASSAKKNSSDSDTDNDTNDAAAKDVKALPPTSSASKDDDAENDASSKSQKGNSDGTVFLNIDQEIFGKAPSSVMDAADAAGAAILAALLGGQQRMLVDVRDSELTSDPATLVQFIELSILPVAAGLEGLQAKRNRLKLVFPTVAQLLQYRKTMALAAPEVVALSTLGLDPVEPQDNLVVIVAPAPDDEEGNQLMNQLLFYDHPENDLEDEHDASLIQSKKAIKQPVVVLNPHMVPIQGPAAAFESVYHLRLLSVQYTASESKPADGYVQQGDLLAKDADSEENEDEPKDDPEFSALDLLNNSDLSPEGLAGLILEDADNDEEDVEELSNLIKDEALEAAMEHARQSSPTPSGSTRAMVIRAYPNPWHIFVDTSPDTDADFTIAGSFKEAPSNEDIQLSIIECLEGSDREDEIVAQQMQQALESGQLDRVSEMFGGLFTDEDETDEDDDEYDPFGYYGLDSV